MLQLEAYLKWSSTSSRCCNIASSIDLIVFQHYVNEISLSSCCVLNMFALCKSFGVHFLFTHSNDCFDYLSVFDKVYVSYQPTMSFVYCKFCILICPYLVKNPLIVFSRKSGHWSIKLWLHYKLIWLQLRTSQHLNKHRMHIAEHGTTP